MSQKQYEARIKLSY